MTFLCFFCVPNSNTEWKDDFILPAQWYNDVLDLWYVGNTAGM